MWPAIPLEANLRALRREIEKAREATQGIIGVNIMVALTTFAEMVRTSIEAKADVIFSGAGLPMDLPKIFNETCERKKEEFKTKLVPIISSGRAATLIARKWMASTGYMPRRLRGGRPQGRRASRLQPRTHR